MAYWNRRKKSAVEKLSKQIEAHDRALAERRAEFNTAGLTDAERQFCVLAEARGKAAFRSGWPDFMVIDRDTGGLVFVEVKTGADDVHLSQAIMFSALESQGMRVCIWRPEEPLVLAPWRRFCSRELIAEGERAIRGLLKSPIRATPENETPGG